MNEADRKTVRSLGALTCCGPSTEIGFWSVSASLSRTRTPCGVPAVGRGGRVFLALLAKPKWRRGFDRWRLGHRRWSARRRGWLRAFFRVTGERSRGRRRPRRASQLDGDSGNHGLGSCRGGTSRFEGSGAQSGSVPRAASAWPELGSLTMMGWSRRSWMTNRTEIRRKACLINSPASTSGMSNRTTGI
jgi:hypothetical protein